MLEIVTTDCTSGNKVKELSSALPFANSASLPQLANLICGSGYDLPSCRLLVHTQEESIALLQFSGWYQSDILSILFPQK